jgi:K+-dependent Na+/Ca+ exchanger-like protein
MKPVVYYLIMILSVMLTMTAHAADESNCDPNTHVEPDDVTRYGFILLILGSVASLWAMAVVCEDFFVPALKVLCKKYKIKDSVAGSSILAAGADAPELFVSFLGIFASNSAIGLGTIIGSEIFNHMCISAGSIYYAKHGNLVVEWKVFTRECLFYLLSLVTFLYAVEGDFSLSDAFDTKSWDSCLEITLVRSIILVVGQVVYVLVCGYFDEICMFFGVHDHDIRHSYSEVPHLDVKLAGIENPLDLLLSQEGDSERLIPVEEVEYSDAMLKTPTGVFHIIWHFTVLPLKYLFYFTIPDVRRNELQKWFLINIVSSTCWLAVLAYVLCKCLELLGNLMGIPVVIMGLTFSAVGTSFPNLWGSMVVAREGRGDMAISNVFGSNTINIFVCLGLPWLVYNVIFGTYDKLQDGGTKCLVIVLIAVLVVYYAMVAFSGWMLKRW